MTARHSLPAQRALREIERARRLLVLEGIGVGNFFAFALISFIVGGSAPSGEVTGTAFFLGDRGRLVEVSSTVYWYSWLHAVSQLVTLPMFACGLVGRILERFKRG